MKCAAIVRSRSRLKMG